MDSQISRPIGHSYDQTPYNAGLHAAGEHLDQHSHEKKSVLKKVKAKAKKIKDTLMHGHGHNHDQEDHDLQHVPDDHDLDEEDDVEEEDEILDESQIHVFDSSAIGRASRPGQVGRLDDPVAYYGKSTAFDDDYARETLAKSVVPRQEEDRGLKVAIDRTSNLKEVPQAPLEIPVSTTPAILEQTKPIDAFGSFSGEQKATRGQPQINLERSPKLEEDPHAPKDRREHYDPSNYQAKVTDSTGARGEETGITPILSSFDKMNFSTDLKQRGEEKFPAKPHDQSIFSSGSHDQFSPEPTPPRPITTEEKPRSISDAPPDASNQTSYLEKLSSAAPAVADRAILAKNAVASKLGYNEGEHNAKEQSSTYTEKISSATSAIADKAILAKNAVASKLRYNNEKGDVNGHEGEELHKTQQTQSPSTVEYGKKIAATVTEKLTPVYQKVAETGNTMVSKVPGIRGNAGNEGEISAKGQDKGVSVKDYFAEKLKPGDEDKALSEVISEALNKQKGEANKPIAKVTESEKVKRRLGSSDVNVDEEVDQSSVHISGGDTDIVGKIKGAVGSLFGKGVEAARGSQQAESPGTTTGFVSANEEETGGRRLQESGN
ncbi:low-temperature-induced 65 kDa protein isoform X2 [Mercurialis annua]|uniref:low-temperature-induced 65 kDa protein isoform X2 n=1 Tax=Mercurialis annua TaxID=3986 RepID=UPI00215E8FC0|nr:low-temperature-induced 65 kDa protein isoform X2 [Mercurialis annua]